MELKPLDFEADGIEDFLDDAITGRLNTEEVLQEVMRAAGGPAAFAQELWKLVSEPGTANQVKARVLIAVLQLMERHSEEGDPDADTSDEDAKQELRKLLEDNGDGT